MQQLKCIEEEWCIEGTWHTEHERKKNIKHKEGVQEDIDVGRAEKYSRIVMRLISH